MLQSFRPRARASRAVFAAFFAFCANLEACGRDVAGPATKPAVVISIAMPSVAIVAGDQALVALRIARTAGFTAPVTIDVTGSPANVTASVETNPVSGDSATIAIRVATGAVPGPYALTLHASAAGVETGSVTLALQVLSPQRALVTVPYCADLAPAWVAFQDGDGSWSRADASVSGGITSFRHEFATPHGAIATLTPALSGVFTVLRVLYGTPTELASLGDTLRVDCGSSSERSWHGSVAGLAANEKAQISSGAFLRFSALPTAPEFSLVGLPSGPQDLLATRSTLADGGAALTAFILRRDVDLPDGAALPSVDFNSAEAFAPAVPTVSITGASTDGVFSLTELLTKNSSMTLPALAEQVATTTRPYFAIPEDRLLPADLQVLHLSTAGPSSTNRTADIYFRAPVSRTLALGAPAAAPAIGAVSSDPDLRMHAVFPPQSDYDRSTAIVFEQATGSALVTISMTPAYAAAHGDVYDLVIPDLSSLAGFDPTWNLRAREDVIWSATRTGGTLPLGRNTAPTNGATRRAAFVQGTVRLH